MVLKAPSSLDLITRMRFWCPFRRPKLSKPLGYTFHDYEVELDIGSQNTSKYKLFTDFIKFLRISMHKTYVHYQILV